MKCARATERERERERRAKAVAFGNCGFFFFFFFFPSLLLLLLPRTRRSLFTHPNLRYINAINTGKTDRIERARRVRGNSRSREHAVRKWIVQDEVGAPVGLPDVGAERVLFDENFPPEHPTTVRGDLREHVETGLEARFRFATRVDGHSVLDD